MARDRELQPVMLENVHFLNVRSATFQFALEYGHSMSSARPHGASRLTAAFSEAWRQDQLLLTAYNDSLRQAFPEAIPQLFDQFGDSYSVIRRSIFAILQKEDEANALRAECHPNFGVSPDPKLGPEAVLAVTLAGLLIHIAEIRSPVAAHASEIGLQLWTFVTQDDRFPLESFDGQLPNELHRLRNQLKIDKMDRLPPSEVQDDFVIVGSRVVFSARVAETAGEGRAVPRLSAVPPHPLDDQPLGWSTDERAEAPIWPIMTIEAAPVAIEGNPRRLSRHSEIVAKVKSAAPQAAAQLPRSPSGQLGQGQPSKTRFWSPFLSWFDYGPPPKRVQSKPQ
jgi:hypothetical protein